MWLHNVCNMIVIDLYRMLALGFLLCGAHFFDAKLVKGFL